jgi:hypothetical protein
MSIVVMLRWLRVFEIGLWLIGLAAHGLAPSNRDVNENSPASAMPRAHSPEH